MRAACIMARMRGEDVMRRTKTTEIIVETDEIFIIRQASSAAVVATPAEFFCEQCGASAELLTPELAATITGASTRAIYRLVEAGLVHFAETAEGRLLVCRNSLAALDALPSAPKQIGGA